MQLVNARSVKNVPGRAKTDKKDAVWLAKLTERGMLQPSFVPPYDIRRLREYTRLRADLVHDRTRQWARLEKLLERALIKVSSVASRLTTQSARASPGGADRRASGTRGYWRTWPSGRCAPSAGNSPRRCTGRFEDHHAELARILLDQIDALTRQIDQLSKRVSELIAQIPAAQGVDADGTTGPGAGRGDDAAVLPAVARLDEITGCGIIAAQAIIAEIGLDMTVFGTPGTAGVLGETVPADPPVRARRTPPGSAAKGNPWLNGVLGEIAASASRTDTFLGERYRRLARRRGKRKALAAIARSILVIIFHLLADPASPVPRPRPRPLRQPGQPRPAKSCNHVRQLQALGLNVTVEEAA